MIAGSKKSSQGRKYGVRETVESSGTNDSSNPPNEIQQGEKLLGELQDRWRDRLKQSSSGIASIMERDGRLRTMRMRFGCWILSRASSVWVKSYGFRNRAWFLCEQVVGEGERKFSEKSEIKNLWSRDIDECSFLFDTRRRLVIQNSRIFIGLFGKVAFE